MNINEAITVDYKEKSEYMAKFAGCTIQQADTWLEAEDKYLESKGMLIDPNDFASEEEFLKHIEELEKEPQHLDYDDMLEYITIHTVLGSKLVNDLADAEYEYEYELGIAGEISYID